MKFSRYLLLRNARIPQKDGRAGRLCDLLLGQSDDQKEGRILRIGPDLPVEDPDKGTWSVYNAKGKVVAPTFTDSYCRFGSPDFFYREDPHSGETAALHGGFSTLFLFPQISPSDPASLSLIRRGFRESRITPHFAASICHRGKRSDIAALRAAGVDFFTDEGADLLSDSDRLFVMRQIKKEGGTLFVQSRTGMERGINEGRISRLAGIDGSAGVLERIAVSKALLLSADTGCPIHIPIVSDAGSVTLLRNAKKEGLPVHCGTSPLYFSLTESELIYRGTAAKVDPPLRTEADRRAVIEGLCDGTIDCICSGHTPLSAYEKQGDLKSARCGAAGLETAFSVGLRFLVQPGYLTLSSLLEKLSTHPAKLCGKTAAPEEGAPADLVLLDVDAEQIFSPQTFSGKAKNSPFFGMPLPGKVEEIFLGGTCLNLAALSN